MVDLFCVAFSDGILLERGPAPAGGVLLRNTSLCFGLTARLRRSNSLPANLVTGQKYPKALLQRPVRPTDGFPAFLAHSGAKGTRRYAPPTPFRFPLIRLRYSAGHKSLRLHRSFAGRIEIAVAAEAAPTPNSHHFFVGAASAAPAQPLKSTTIAAPRLGPGEKRKKIREQGLGCLSRRRRRVPSPPDFSSIAAYPTNGRAGPRSKWFWVLFPTCAAGAAPNRRGRARRASAREGASKEKCLVRRGRNPASKSIPLPQATQETTTKSNRIVGVLYRSPQPTR